MRFALLLTALALSLRAADEYPRAEERQKILDAIEALEQENIPLRLEGYRQRTEEERRFLRFFRDHIYPIEMKSRRLLGIALMLEVALDRALYESEAEKKRWQQKMNDLFVELQEIATSPEWKRAIRQWARLSTGLRGEVAKRAREAVREDRLSGFSVRERPLLSRLIKLEIDIEQQSNESSVTGKDLSEHQRASDELERRFRAREITLEQLREGLQELWGKSRHAKGHDMLQKAGPLFNEAAIIRTRLAQSKGFQTWAEYQLATRRPLYGRGMKSVADHTEFLEQLLSTTLESAINFRRTVWASAGYTLRDAAGIDMEFFAPEEDNLLRDYFIAENVNDVWLETMRESGFEESDLRRINLDSFPGPISIPMPI